MFFFTFFFSGLKEEGILRVPGNAGRVKVENPPLLFLFYTEVKVQMNCIVLNYNCNLLSGAFALLPC